MLYLIYKYVFPNDKVYIGQTKKGSNRLNHSSFYKGQVVYNAMKKYKVWDTEILLECPEHLADWWETSMIKIHDSMNPDKGYNRESGGNKNKHISTESRKKMSESKKGKYTGLNNSFYGKNHSDETKKKISESKKKPVYLIDTIEGWTKYYDSMKDICNIYSDWNYGSLKQAARLKKLFNKRYKIEYIN